MGLFELIFPGRERRVFEDRIWMTVSRKLEDMAVNIRAHDSKKTYPVVVTHFKTTHAKVLETLSKANLKAHVLAPPEPFPSEIREEWIKDGKILVVMSDIFPPLAIDPDKPKIKKDEKKPAVTIHMAEHYPTPDRDERVLAMDSAWPMRMDFLCYVSLEDPIMAHAGGHKLGALMKKHGHKEDKVVTHYYLSQSIRMAQRALAKKVTQDQACDSPEEWFKKNLPGEKLGC